MNVRAAILGGPSFPRTLAGALVVIAAIAGFGWLYVLDVVYGSLPDDMVFYGGIGALALVSTVAVGICAFRMEGLLFGWLVGIAPYYLAFVSLLDGGRRKTGEWTVIDVLLGGVFWAVMFSFVFCALGLVLGVSLRWITVRRERS